MYLQVLLSKDDLKMMIDEVSGDHCSAAEDCTVSTVNIETFLLIMENTAW
jgi:hypothetical protein